MNETGQCESNRESKHSQIDKAIVSLESEVDRIADLIRKVESGPIPPSVPSDKLPEQLIYTLSGVLNSASVRIRDQISRMQELRSKLEGMLF